jgi:hypothetical protein
MLPVEVVDAMPETVAVTVGLLDPGGDVNVNVRLKVPL